MIKGLPNLRTTMAAIAERGLVACEDATQAQAGQVRIDSMLATPVDTGALCDSHFVLPPLRFKNRVVSTLEAGGWLAPYAIRVHEDLGMRHPRGGEAKFMTRAIRRAQSRITAIFEDRVVKGLRL